MNNKFKLLSAAAITCCMIALLMGFTFDKGAKSSFVETTIPMWKMAKMHTLEVLDAMPEDKFNYQPTEVSKSFASQMVHIGYTLKYFKHGMIEGDRIEYNEPDAASMSKAEIRTMVEEGFDVYIEAVSKLSDEDLKVELPFGPEKKITRGQSIIFAHDHVTNHRAKANLYIRMNDIDPPGYKFI